MGKAFLLFIALLLAIASSAQKKETYFLSQPCLSPDGQIVVFGFEGDLWKATVSDGQAVRLTAMQGYETSARISPDGKWIAFTGRQYSNGDVYIMPLAGGDIQQITYNSSNDEVNSWSWDGKSHLLYQQSHGPAIRVQGEYNRRHSPTGFWGLFFPI